MALAAADCLQSRELTGCTCSLRLIGDGAYQQAPVARPGPPYSSRYRVVSACVTILSCFATSLHLGLRRTVISEISAFSFYFLTTGEATWYIISRAFVCLSVI